jgi:hypothetical protein
MHFSTWEEDLLHTPAHILKKRALRLEQYYKDNPRQGCPLMNSEKKNG